MTECNGKPRPRSREDIRRQLISGCRGSFREWRRACEDARDAGWSEKEVDNILLWHHPWVWVCIVFPFALILIILLGALVSWISKM